ncbi:uncharacterized protein zgc:158701 [Pimephales promelas]|uniref:uncharacterized protein zgc:158701 n=1 Tax=Pimephales promelas TaxID=90988 RepID=UPI001955DB3A|nr:uncharacterized protein zgc:158701 [Pimephales promelas]KAG1947811.1 hypothetical protein F2P79_012649 [Pimephales promelas]
MKFQVLLLAFALVIATNIYCQAQPQRRDSDKSPEVSRRQVRTCNCSGRRFENCPCELQRQYRVLKEQKAFCQKKGSATSKICQRLTGGIRKQKKGNIGSMPI